MTWDGPEKRSEGRKLRRWWFAAAVAVMGLVFAIYGVNIAFWADSPDFGWRFMFSSGPNVVTEVFGPGEKAGLQVGDTIEAINGKPCSTVRELYLEARNEAPGSVNTYSVLRDGKTINIRVVTGRLGIGNVSSRSLPLFVIGIIYVGIGILVYLMNPRALESRAFFILSAVLGVEIGFSAPSYLIRPLWIYDFRFLAELLIPAALVHLGLLFPKKRAIVARRPWVVAVPYILSFIFFLLARWLSTSRWDSPKAFDMAESIYLSASMVMFITMLVWNVRRDNSIVVRLQSRVILVGLVLGLFVPLLDLLSRLLWNVFLFPNPAVGFAVCLTAFPLSIGYTIVKHDLFAIDVIVRRTYGYVLSTGTIIGVYALVISLMNLLFQGSEISRSPLFSLVFALGSVFCFRPLHGRIQGGIDRLFYRQRYDYRKTIKTISEALTTLQDPVRIRKLLVGSLVDEMVLENGLLMLRDPVSETFRVLPEEFPTEGSELTGSLREEEPVVDVLRSRGSTLFRHDLELDPMLAGHADAIRKAFRTFGAEAMVPLIYKENMVGIVSLGRKKSGQPFTAEDHDLLRTVGSQGAVALENARLFEENLRKGRMEEELKIARDIQASMLPEKAPETGAFAIAARSISAREVGGDFFDFVEIDGQKEGERVAILVGDVSGKAVSGALVMAASRSVFRVLAETCDSAEEIMNRGNARFCRDVRRGMFVAVIYAVLDSSNRTLTLSNAGQTQPIHCTADGSAPIFIETDGDRFPLGIVEECRYLETSIPLQRGDTVVFYTDGIVEAINDAGELFGFERVLTSIGENRTLGVDAILDNLIKDVFTHTGEAEQHDDITVVVVKVK